MKSKSILFVVFLLFVTLFNGIVMAASSAPTGIIISGNSSADFDEGSFFVNWTNASVDANYTVYIWVNGALFNTSATNTSSTGFSYSNTTEANYSFTIQANNGTVCVASGCANSSANASIFVDSTAPTISLPLYTNATAGQNSSTFILNISVSDAISGVNSTSNCLIDVNGTNQSVLVSSGWCNTTTIGLSGLNDGVRIVNVYVNDTANNFGLNNTFYLVADTTSPFASATCTPASLHVGDIVTCTCSGSDATSGVLTSTASSTPDTSNTGTFSYSCTVTDNAGNSVGASATYIIEQVAANFGGGSGGSSTTTNEWTKQKVSQFSKITSGSSAIIKNFDSEIGLKAIEISVNNEAKSVKVTVRKYDAQPVAVSVEKDGKVNQYLQIDVENVEGKLSNAKISLKVPKAWINSNGLEKENIALFKFDEAGEKWNELETNYVDEDDTFYYYEAEVTSFSYFAISEKNLETTQNTEEEKTSAFGNIFNGNKDGEKNSSKSWVLIIVVLVILAVIFLKKRR